jgi:hypothetical protein
MSVIKGVQQDGYFFRIRMGKREFSAAAVPVSCRKRKQGEPNEVGEQMALFLAHRT